jgi:DNA-binding NtrC family response regulator
MAKVLIVDDEVEMLESLKKILLHRENYDVTCFSDPNQAIAKIENTNFDFVISDMKMGELTGIDVLKSVKKSSSETKVIMISGYGTIESSVEAIKLGAFDFIEKPFTSKKLFEVLDKAHKTSVLIDDENENLPTELARIIHQSKKMKDVIEVIQKVAPTEMNTLIYGESGTGKELVARAIHSLSKGKNNPFVPVNCGALPEQLFESELFGHEKGAFTGAVNTKPGLVEFAEGGTFFFDEIGEMTPALQVKLLRMIEDRKIRRVGGKKEIDVNVRIVAATNKDLEKLIDENKFRDDLFYRLNNIKIEIPPLRERQEDIMPLAKHYMSQLCSSGSDAKKFTSEAEQALLKYSWPGNVRELQNLINRTYLLCSSEIIRLEDIPLPALKRQDSLLDEFLHLDYKDAKDLVLENFEIEYLKYHLKMNDGNITKTAQDCGIDRRSIHRLISKYNIIYKD